MPLTLWLQCARDGALADLALHLHLVSGVVACIVVAVGAPYSSSLSFALSVRVWHCHLHCGGAGRATAFKLIGSCAFVCFFSVAAGILVGVGAGKYSS